MPPPSKALVTPGVGCAPGSPRARKPLPALFGAAGVRALEGLGPHGLRNAVARAVAVLAERYAVPP